MIDFKKYPEIINDVLVNIDEVRQETPEISIMDIVMDFADDHNIHMEQMGDIISSSYYFKDLFESDCKYHLIIKSKKSRDDEWELDDAN